MDMSDYLYDHETFDEFPRPGSRGPAMSPSLDYSADEYVPQLESSTSSEEYISSQDDFLSLEAPTYDEDVIPGQRSPPTVAHNEQKNSLKFQEIPATHIPEVSQPKVQEKPEDAVIKSRRVLLLDPKQSWTQATNPVINQTRAQNCYKVSSVPNAAIQGNQGLAGQPLSTAEKVMLKRKYPYLKEDEEVDAEKRNEIRKAVNNARERLRVSEIGEAFRLLRSACEPFIKERPENFDIQTWSKLQALEHSIAIIKQLEEEARQRGFDPKTDSLRILEADRKNAVLKAAENCKKLRQ